MIIDSYREDMPLEVGEAWRDEIHRAGTESVRFAWAGPADRSQGHAYRIQGPTFLIEFNNTQNNANHVHSVWRNMLGDFGVPLAQSSTPPQHCSPTGAFMHDWTRREFLASTAPASAIQGNFQAQAAKRDQSPQVKSEPAKVPPSEKLVLGFIGVGGMGTGLINTFKAFPDVAIAAVCDVYEPHLRALNPRPVGHPSVTATFVSFSTARISTQSSSPRPTIGTASPPSWPARPARTSTARSRWRTGSKKAERWSRLPRSINGSPRWET